ncbi:hypothetical protein AGR1C_pAt20271 [Agrobacterium fabacearum TT111]|nr:hypothetical protein AGR1C_pAt20271 [Agrobacterium fabacearum TT111]
MFYDLNAALSDAKRGVERHPGHDLLEIRSDGRPRRKLLKVWCSGRGCVGLHAERT